MDDAAAEQKIVDLKTTIKLQCAALRHDRKRAVASAEEATRLVHEVDDMVQRFEALEQVLDSRDPLTAMAECARIMQEICSSDTYQRAIKAQRPQNN